MAQRRSQGRAGAGGRRAAPHLGAQPEARPRARLEGAESAAPRPQRQRPQADLLDFRHCGPCALPQAGAARRSVGCNLLRRRADPGRVAPCRMQSDCRPDAGTHSVASWSEAIAPRQLDPIGRRLRCCQARWPNHRPRPVDVAVYVQNAMQQAAGSGKFVQCSCWRRRPGCVLQRVHSSSSCGRTEA